MADINYIYTNLNDYVSVRLTDIGREELKRQHDELYDDIGVKKPDYRPKEEDSNGWSTWQIHVLMNTFGGILRMGPKVPFETEIRIHLKVSD